MYGKIQLVPMKNAKVKIKTARTLACSNRFMAKLKQPYNAFPGTQTKFFHKHCVFGHFYKVSMNITLYIFQTWYNCRTISNEEKSYKSIFSSLLIVLNCTLFGKCTICNGKVEMTKSRIVCEKTLFGVLEAWPWFYLFAWQWLYICSSCLDSEPLHFSLEAVEFFHASLYRWSL